MMRRESSQPFVSSFFFFLFFIALNIVLATSTFQRRISNSDTPPCAVSCGFNISAHQSSSSSSSSSSSGGRQPSPSRKLQLNVPNTKSQHGSGRRRQLWHKRSEDICLAPWIAPSPSPLPVSSVVCFDNGPNDDLDAFTINFGFEVTNSFTLPEDTYLSNATFVTWGSPGDQLTALDYLITTGSSPWGSTALSGSGVSPDCTFQYTNGFGFDISSCTFLIDDSSQYLFPANTVFWLQIQNAVASNGDPIYWAESSAPTNEAWDNEIGQLTPSNGPNDPPYEPEAFVICGDIVAADGR